MTGHDSCVSVQYARRVEHGARIFIFKFSKVFQWAEAKVSSLVSTRRAPSRSPCCFAARRKINTARRVGRLLGSHTRSFFKSSPMRMCVCVAARERESSSRVD